MREDSRYRRVECMVASLLACLVLQTSMVFVEHISWSEPRCALFRALSDLRPCDSGPRAWGSGGVRVVFPQREKFEISVLHTWRCASALLRSCS